MNDRLRPAPSFTGKLNVFWNISLPSHGELETFWEAPASGWADGEDDVGEGAVCRKGGGAVGWGVISGSKGWIRALGERQISMCIRV